MNTLELNQLKQVMNILKMENNIKTVKETRNAFTVEAGTVKTRIKKSTDLDFALKQVVNTMNLYRKSM